MFDADRVRDAVADVSQVVDGADHVGVAEASLDMLPTVSVTADEFDNVNDDDDDVDTSSLGDAGESDDELETSSVTSKVTEVDVDWDSTVLAVPREVDELSD